MVRPGARGFLSQSLRFPDMFISLEFQNWPTQNKAVLHLMFHFGCVFRWVLLRSKLPPQLSAPVPWDLRVPCNDLPCPPVIGWGLSSFSVPAMPTQMGFQAVRPWWGTGVRPQCQKCQGFNLGGSPPHAISYGVSGPEPH